MFKPLALILALAWAPSVAMAQDIFVPPVTTADPGYLFPNDQYQRDRQSAGGSTSVPAKPVEIELDAAAQARVRAAIQALVPEYQARAKRDGEESANRWIGQKAFELGQREADLIKQRLGLD